MSSLLNNRFTLFAVVIFGFLATGCAGKKDLTQASTGDIPQWYTKPPADKEYLYGVYTAASQDMQLSVDKATVGANQEIAKQVEVRIQGLQKSFTEEVGAGDDSQLLQQFTQATRAVVSQTLIGVRVKEKKTVRDGNIWRTYVLAELPVGEANKALLSKLNSQKELLTRIRSTETFKELDSEVSKYESSR